MRPYRVGPWPGLTPSGAGVLIGCAVLMALGQLLVGPPRTPLPDLPLLGAVALVPMVLATRIVSAPGVASAVCGAYLMPRALLSLAQPGLELPPLLLVPAIAFDLALWLRAGDLAAIARAWPRSASPWRKPTPRARRTVTTVRALIAGAIFGVALSLVEPPFAMFLGADPSRWSDVWLAGVLTVGVCAAVAPLSARGTAS